MLWTNVFLAVVGLASFVSMVLMIGGWFRHRREWNIKTRDYWYGRLMWAVVGVAYCLEEIIREKTFRYTSVLIAAAVFATLKGNLQKGKWGNRE